MKYEKPNIILILTDEEDIIRTSYLIDEGSGSGDEIEF